MRDFINEACGSLERLYPAQEARSIVSVYLEETLGVKSYTHITEPSRSIPESGLGALQEGLKRLSSGEPLQYVLGYADFCGHRFKVGPSVLIPRPETEQMVRCSLENLRPGSRVLDLCTGSGCIAWSVFLGAQDVEVTGVDISPEALECARSQFDGPGPDFVLSDILCEGWTGGLGKFDLLLSNPPYVMEREKALMRGNVLDYEPQIAIFVPDDDPLLFYRAIALAAPGLMKEGARGMVEINEALGEQTAAVFASAGLSDVRIERDFCNKARFVSFRK